MAEKSIVKKKAVIKDGWFHEFGDMWPGQALTLQVDEVLFDASSQFQHVLVFRSRSHGVVLVLDGAIQVTEHDEFAYGEMLSHLPLFAHRQPERVLVIGGGDGSCLREIGKHSCVKEIVICELDEMVINTAKKFLPKLACGFDDERVKVFIGDGAEYMKKHANYFDVIIVDSSDPIGPAAVLFESPFYQTMKNALRDGGIVATQCESMWLHGEQIKTVIDFCRGGGFKHVQYAWTTVPTYPSGMIGFAICSMAEQDSATPQRTPDAATQDSLRYYTPEVHRAAFVLPAFVKRLIDGKSN